MARIRSIHPGFFTDEQIVSVSAFARLLIIGLGTEADDKGIFEWKPLTIKMRIFPADDVDVPALLAELEGANAIKKYEICGRQFGAIRNFREHQRPKTPNDIHPISEEMRNYVGLSKAVPETTINETGEFLPKGETFHQKGEKSPQMEDGGWREGVEESRGKEERKPPSEVAAIAPHGAPLPTKPSAKKISIKTEEIPEWNGDNADQIPQAALIKIRPAFRLPDDWYAFAENLGWPENRIFDEFDKLKGWATIGKGKNKRRSITGWNQTWINWIGKASERGANG